MAHTVRTPEPTDAAAMARVHVDTWSETYRGIMPDELLDDPDLIDRRQRMWAQILAEALANSRAPSPNPMAGWSASRCRTAGKR